MLSIVLAFGGVVVLAIIAYFYALNDTAKENARKAKEGESKGVS